MSVRQLVSRPNRWVAFGYACALAAVGLVSVLVLAVERLVHLPNASMLYLIAVLGAAVAFGRGPAILASVAAVLTYNWLFIPPYNSLIVAEPAELVVLSVFLLVAIVTSQLAARQRQQALEAQRREREAVVLYDVARLMGGPDLREALRSAIERLREELQVDGVAVEMTDGALAGDRVEVGSSEALERARRASAGPSHLLGEGQSPSSDRRGAPGRWIRIVSPGAGRAGAPFGGKRSERHVVPIKAGDRRVGTLLLVSAPDRPAFDLVDDRLLSAVATQLGIAIERFRLRREATEAEILRRSDELKTALLNAVSHDLRTPLASVMAASESLLHGGAAWSEDDRRRLAEAINTESRRLDRIVGNLLDLSRIEGGSLRPQKEWYDLGALVDDVLGRLRPALADHPIRLNLPDALPPVELDYIEIDQVLTNLIENGARYSPPGAPIEVAAVAIGSEVRVTVGDRGPGIPPESLSQVFEPFFRLPARKTQSSGTGLGLSVARGLVQAHGGRIWATNRPEGGACFVFTLPLTHVDLPKSPSTARLGDRQ